MKAAEADANAGATAVLQQIIEAGHAEMNEEGVVTMVQSAPATPPQIDSPFASKRLEA